MKIVILGAGQVGETLAENLVKEENDITLVDVDSNRLTELQLKLDIQTIQGSAAHPDILLKAGCEHADMLIAVTNCDEVNMLACFISYNLFRTPNKVARIRSQDFLSHSALFANDKLPIDVCISPEVLITNQIKRLIEYPGTSQVLDFAEGQLQLIVVKPQPGGLMVGKNLKQLYNHLTNIPMKIAAIFRDNVSLPLTDETEVFIDDEILFLASPEAIQHTLIALGRFNYLNQRIIIAGGGHIGKRLTQVLENDYRVKVIEHGLDRAEYLATQLNKATILHGDVADRELLINENIEFTDVFVAVTNDDEANIMSCLQAKKLGVTYVMSLITRKAYVDLVEDSSIDFAISPQLITISSILTKLRRGDMVSVYSLRSGNAEAIEVIIHGDEHTSKVVGQQISQIKLPPECSIAAVIRSNQILLQIDDLILQAEDHVILLVMNKRYIKHVEQLFQVRIAYFG
jgi:trk system potassium uptake protein TrkA